jgi:hypothetical protein
VRQGRSTLLVSLGLSFALVGFSLFRYPAITGTASVSLGYLLLCAAILGLYGWVGMDALRARSSSPEQISVLWYGMGAGVLTSIVLFACTGISDVLLSLLWTQGPAHWAPTTLLSIDHRIEEWALGVPTLLGMALTIVAGVVLTQRTGSIVVGAQVGLWSGMLNALGLLVTGLALNNALAGTLAHSEWLQDPTCALSRPLDLAACEVGDTLGGAASVVLLLPLLWIGLGLLAGLIGRARSNGTQSHSLVQDRTGVDGTVATVAMHATAEITAQPARLRPLLLFSLVLLATFVAGVGGHLW